jgi:hypothetical protein
MGLQQEPGGRWRAHGRRGVVCAGALGGCLAGEKQQPRGWAAAATTWGVGCSSGGFVEHVTVQNAPSVRREASQAHPVPSPAQRLKQNAQVL